MKARLNFMKTVPAASHALYGVEVYLEKTELEAPLLELVRLRASQINGCAYCIDMHTKEARAAGETEQRLYLVSAWRESPFFSDRERAALLWTEQVTLVSEESVQDEAYETVRKQFNEKELVNLTLAVIAINGWNRFNIAFRTVAGEYQPTKQAAAS